MKSSQKIKKDGFSYKNPKFDPWVLTQGQENVKRVGLGRTQPSPTRHFTSWVRLAPTLITR